MVGPLGKSHTPISIIKSTSDRLAWTSVSVALSSKEVPAGYPNKNRKRAGDDGKRKKAGAEALLPLFPLPIVPSSL